MEDEKLIENLYAVFEAETNHGGSIVLSTDEIILKFGNDASNDQIFKVLTIMQNRRMIKESGMGLRTRYFHIY
jgi:cephalosporin hydroxylase